jgi:hypothetical protein
MHHAVSSTLISEPFDTIMAAVVETLPFVHLARSHMACREGINIVAKATAAFASKFMHRQVK